jgi:sugar phosphate isomerase/epimerase
MGARGVVIDAASELSPTRLTETGRRELRYLFRSVELTLIALTMPTRRPFDTNDQLDDRLRRAEGAFTLGYELGTNVILANVGGVPAEADATRREIFLGALRELARRADHRGVRLTIETGPDPGPTLRKTLDGLASPGLAASIDPAALMLNGHDPIEAVRMLGPWVAHAYARDATASVAPNLQTGRAGFPPGVLDWDEFLGALEEVAYRGFLTVWPDPNRSSGLQFAGVADRLSRL